MEILYTQGPRHLWQSPEEAISSNTLQGRMSLSITEHLPEGRLVYGDTTDLLSATVSIGNPVMLKI